MAYPQDMLWNVVYSPCEHGASWEYGSVYCLALMKSATLPIANPGKSQNQNSGYGFIECLFIWHHHKIRKMLR